MLALTVAYPVAAALPLLSCTLQAPARAAAGRPLLLTFSVSNPGPQAVDLLVWGTPFEADWFSPYVEVRRGDSALRYRGAKMKRGEPVPGDYLRFAAGQQRQAEVDLSRAFALGVPGRYRVQPRIVLHDVAFAGFAADPTGTARVPRPRDQHTGTALDCNSVEFEIGS